MNIYLEYALEYARRGWPVFPLHTVKNGLCSCGRDPCIAPGKHPQTSKGLKSATTDKLLIRKWWMCMPDANIGIVTGRTSGLCVIDIDEGGWELNQDRDFPSTLQQITGSGGSHLVYRLPEDESKYKTGAHILPNIDSRCEGGYIVAAPSLHHSGNRYKWIDLDEEIEDAPGWWLELILTKESDSKAAEWNPDNGLPRHSKEALEAIKEKADFYDDWLRVAMAIHYADPENGLVVFDWWSGLSPKYNPDSVRRLWHTLSKRQHAVDNPTTFESVFYWAREAGWENPDVQHGMEIVIALEGQPPRKKIILPPVNIIPQKGLLSDLIEYIDKTQYKKIPLLSLAASLSFLGALSGRKYASSTGLRPNVYIIGAAETGIGKSFARHGVDNIATDAGLEKYLGGTSFASGQAIISSLHDHPSKLFMLDEIGLRLKEYNSPKASSHQQEVMTNLLELYTSSGGTYRGKEYSDRKTNAQKILYNPCACVYGTTTPSTFYEALTSSDSVSGFFPRLLYVEIKKENVYDNQIQKKYDTSELCKRLKAIADFNSREGNLKDLAPGTIRPPEAKIIPFSDSAEEIWLDFRKAIDYNVSSEGVEETEKVMYTRAPENCLKLAMIYAVSISHTNPIIDDEAILWAKEFVRWTTTVIIEKMKENVSDTSHEKNLRRILKIIKESNGWLNRTELSRKTQFLKTMDRNSILDQLEESGNIKVRMGKQKGVKGKGTKEYCFIED